MEYYAEKRDSRLFLPPFGKILQAYIEEKVKLDIFITIYVGSKSKEIAYEDKRMGGMCCYLPYGDSYESYRWPVLNQKVLIEDTSLVSVNFLKKMCIHIFTIYEPMCIFLYSKLIPKEETIQLYRPELYPTDGIHDQGDIYHD